MGSGEVRGEVLNKPEPIAPLSKWPNTSSLSMLDATADSKSNDSSGTQTGLSQVLAAGPAFAIFCQPRTATSGAVLPSFHRDSHRRLLKKASGQLNSL